MIRQIHIPPELPARGRQVLAEAARRLQKDCDAVDRQPPTMADATGLQTPPKAERIPRKA